MTIFMIASCGKKKSDDAKVVATRGDRDNYRGYDIYGAAKTCAIPEPDRICTKELSPLIMANQNFADICESKKFKAYDCGCEKSFLCSAKLEILVSGYDYRGKFARDIEHSKIIYCPDSGTFDPERSGRQQEAFRLKCETAGHKAVLVGCNFKKYLCTRKI